jgi:antitoxin FitA
MGTSLAGLTHLHSHDGLLIVTPIVPFSTSAQPHACAINDCNAIIAIMASITIRKLEETTKRKLKVRAALHGRSMEQEVREILKSAVQQTTQKPRTGADLVAAIRRRFVPLGGVELEPYPRGPIRDPDIE